MKHKSQCRKVMLQVIQDERPFNLATLLGHILAQQKSIRFHVQELKKEWGREASQSFFLVCLLYKVYHTQSYTKTSFHPL